MLEISPKNSNMNKLQGSRRYPEFERRVCEGTWAPAGGAGGAPQV